jgi:aminoglycoside phosphotransferase (APT) family kinase protein
LYRLGDTAKEHAWLRDGVDWLINNRPPEPERLSICHGDFHPWNILVKDGKVTAVLDWPGFIVADPALDVACTTFLFTVLKIMYPEIDWMEFSEEYLDTYRTISSRDVKYLEYYRVLRCVTAFVDGIVGQELWTRPPIAEHLTKYIREATGIRMMPANQPQ